MLVVITLFSIVLSSLGNMIRGGLLGSRQNLVIRAAHFGMVSIGVFIVLSAGQYGFTASLFISLAMGAGIALLNLPSWGAWFTMSTYAEKSDNDPVLDRVSFMKPLWVMIKNKVGHVSADFACMTIRNAYSGVVMLILGWLYVGPMASVLVYVAMCLSMSLSYYVGHKQFRSNSMAECLSGGVQIIAALFLVAV